MKHKNRANYQAEIYKHFMSQNPEIPSPVGNGWKKITSENKEEKLAIDWMDLNPAPNSTLEPMNRSCQIIKCAKKKKDVPFLLINYYVLIYVNVMTVKIRQLSTILKHMIRRDMN